MKRHTILITLLLCASGAMAQGITAKENVIDCGQVVYRQPVTATFEITNNSNQPLSITDVRTSCGCTSANYPTTTIAHNESAAITATFDAQTMGHFNKQAAVFTSASSQPLILTMRGIVVDEIVDFDGKYPFQLGKLNVDKTYIEFDDVNKGEIPLQKIYLQNASDESVHPTFMHLPEYIKTEVSPSTLAPRRSGVATIYLDSRKLRDFGLTQTSIYLGSYIGDKISEEKEINISAILLPYFSESALQQTSTAPRVQLSTNELNLGEFSGKKKLKGEITIQNVGNSTLEIQRLQMFTEGIQLSLSSKKIAPQQTAKLKVTAIAKELKHQKSKPRVLIITNDPQQPKIIIGIEAKQ